MDRRRDRELARRCAVLGDHREELLDEERIALCGLGDPAQQVGSDLGFASKVLEQLLSLEGGERREHDRVAQRVP